MKKIQIAVSVLVVLALAVSLTVSTLVASADERQVAFNLLPTDALDIEPRQPSDDGRFDVELGTEGELIFTLTELGGSSGYFGARFLINEEINIIASPTINFSIRAEGVTEEQLETARGLVFNLNTDFNVAGEDIRLQLRSESGFLNQIEVDDNDNPIVPQSGTLDVAAALSAAGAVIPENGYITLTELVFWGAASNATVVGHPGFPGTQFIWEYLYFEGEPQEGGAPAPTSEEPAESDDDNGNNEPAESDDVTPVTSPAPSVANDDDSDIPWLIIGIIGGAVLLVLIIIIAVVARKKPSGDVDAVIADEPAAVEEKTDETAE